MSPSLIIPGHRSTPSRSPLAAQATIIAGQSVPVNTFQYTVSLRRDSSTTTFCGGTLIAEEYVLTAAHCALEEITYVVIGEVSNRAVLDTPSDRVYGVRELWIHPQYKETFLNILIYDAAIIRLDRAVSEISRLNVPVMYFGDRVIGGQVGHISGWGCTEIPTDDTGACQTRVPYTMQYTTTEIISNDACMSTILSLDPTIIPPKGKLGSSIVCTQSSNSQSTCFGDSGGPLVVRGYDDDGNTSSKSVLVGITSWGFKCGSRDYPFGFGRVSAFRDFIDAHVTGQQWTSSISVMDFPTSSAVYSLSRQLSKVTAILVLTVLQWILW